MRSGRPPKSPPNARAAALGGYARCCPHAERTKRPLPRFHRCRLERRRCCRPCNWRRSASCRPNQCSGDRASRRPKRPRSAWSVAPIRNRSRTIRPIRSRRCRSRPSRSPRRGSPCRGAVPETTVLAPRPPALAAPLGRWTDRIEMRRFRRSSPWCRCRRTSRPRAPHRVLPKVAGPYRPPGRQMTTGMHGGDFARPL